MSAQPKIATQDAWLRARLEFPAAWLRRHDDYPDATHPSPEPSAAD